MLALPLLVLVGGCEYEEYGLAIEEQPQGGANVNTLTCSFRVWSEEEDPDRVGSIPADIKAVWTNEEGAHKTEKFTCAQAACDETTTMSAPQGLFLDKTFWVVITWVPAGPLDATGRVESEKAECTVQ